MFFFQLSDLDSDVDKKREGGLWEAMIIKMETIKGHDKLD